MQGAARFEAHRRLPFEAETVLDDGGGFGKLLRDIAGFDAVVDREIAGHRRVHERRIGSKRIRQTGDRGKIFPLDIDQLGGVFRFPSGSGDDGGDRFPCQPTSSMAIGGCGGE